MSKYLLWNLGTASNGPFKLCLEISIQPSLQMTLLVGGSEWRAQELVTCAEGHVEMIFYHFSITSDSRGTSWWRSGGTICNGVSTLVYRQGRSCCLINSVPNRPRTRSATRTQLSAFQLATCVAARVNCMKTLLGWDETIVCQPYDWGGIVK